MNAYQKATLLISLVFLPLVLLFTKGMGYPHVEIVGLTGVALVGALMYALRTVHRSERAG
jgi:antibiotic biosynthesis monooxygenase (ABM) superfamily enzyme